MAVCVRVSCDCKPVFNRHLGFVALQDTGRLTTMCSRQAIIWDTLSGQKVRFMPLEAVHACVFSAVLCCASNTRPSGSQEAQREHQGHYVPQQKWAGQGQTMEGRAGLWPFTASSMDLTLCATALPAPPTDSLALRPHLHPTRSQHPSFPNNAHIDGISQTLPKYTCFVQIRTYDFVVDKTGEFSTPPNLMRTTVAHSGTVLFDHESEAIVYDMVRPPAPACRVCLQPLSLPFWVLKFCV